MANLRVKITGDSSGFNAALAKVKMRAQAAANSMRASFNSALGSRFAGLLGTAAVAAFTKRTMDMASTIRDASDAMGIGAEQLQKWQFAAEQTGAKFEDVRKVIERIQRLQVDAKLGNKASAGFLGELGISRTADAGQIMGGLSTFAGGNDAAHVIGTFRRAINESAPKLIPMLKQLESLGDKAESIGAIMSDEEVNTLANAKDQMSQMGRILTVSLAPALIFVTEKMVMLTGHIRALGALIGGMLGSGAMSGQGGNIRSALGNLVTGVMTRNVGQIARAFSKTQKSGLGAAFANSYSGAKGLAAEELAAAMQIIESLRSGRTPTVGDGGGGAGGALGKFRRSSNQADSLAKVGLFTASGLNSQPVMTLMQQQLRELQGINRNTKNGVQF